MTTDVKIFDEWSHVSVRRGGSDGLEEYDEETFFLRIHGPSDMNLWIDESCAKELLGLATQGFSAREANSPQGKSFGCNESLSRHVARVSRASILNRSTSPS